MDSEEIAQLAARAQKGDREAFDALIFNFQPLVFRLALSLLDDSQEAQDAAQETFIKVFRGLGSFRRESSFRTWLFAITLNVCRGQLRKRKRNQQLMSVLDSLGWSSGRKSISPERQVLFKERKGTLMRSVAALPADQRTTLILRYYHEMTIAEIADLMGVVERTVYVRLRKAFERLQEDLGELQD
jgi:RNA polymerase sigma-70 factor (ECF subfamily)